MKKNDIKIGMVVETRDGDFYLIKEREGDIILAGKDTWSSLSTYSDELKWCLNGKEHLLDIVKIYKCDAYSIDTLFDKEYLTLLWERQREIDWSKVPTGTKVLVGDSTSYMEPMIFVGYLPFLTRYPFLAVGNYNEDVASYSQCRIHESVEIKEEWYK